MIYENLLFQFEDFKIQTYNCHEMSLYIEDDYMGALDFDGNKNQFERLESVSGIFLNEDSFWNELKIRFLATIHGWNQEELLDKFYPEIKDELSKEFKRMEAKSNIDYIDNYRVCKIGDAIMETEYQRRFKKGCCGFMDEIITINKEQYKLGFNYGH